MTDESDVKTTRVRTVNRTMSYKDRRGYIYIGPLLCRPTHTFIGIIILNFVIEVTVQRYGST